MLGSSKIRRQQFSYKGKAYNQPIKDSRFKCLKIKESQYTLYKGVLRASAPALQTARDTARIAFAPSFRKQSYLPVNALSQGKRKHQTGK